MLLYDDFRKRIADCTSGGRIELHRSDIEIDTRGFADFVVKTFRFKDQAAIGELVERIRGLEFVERCDQSGDYVNISIRAESLFSVLDGAISSTGIFPDVFQDPERVVVEHTSANPTGPIHVGRIRNSIIGDSVARIYSRYGYRVSTQYFVNDSGKQVMAMYAGFLRYCAGLPLSVENLLHGYQEIYRHMDELGGEGAVISPLLKRYETPDENLLAEIKNACSVVLKDIRETMNRLGISIEDYIWESGFLQSEELNEVFESLKPKLKGDGDARYVQMPWGKKEYLVRSDGTRLYLARDLAYHLFKAHHFDVIVDVLGEDHKDYARTIGHVLSDLMEVDRRFEFLIYSFISLEGAKLSTRQGNIITVNDLIERGIKEASRIVSEKDNSYDSKTRESIAEAVAVSSIRFNVIRVNPQKAIVFRWDEALSTEGDSAPFVMYSFARSTSILDKGTGSNLRKKQFDLEEKSLLWNMYLYPESLERSLASRRPDLIAAYVLSLTKAFNDFYSVCQVNVQDDEVRGTRRRIVEMYRTIVKDAAGLLGIKMLERM